MVARSSHGVVVVRVSTQTIHQPESGSNHGYDAMTTEDWELFPNIAVAIESGFKPVGLVSGMNTNSCRQDKAVIDQSIRPQSAP